MYDSRLEKLGNLVNCKNIIQTQIKITDIAGLVKGASEGTNIYLIILHFTFLLFYILTFSYKI